MASDQDWTGKTLGKYQILKRLGQGGMGVVYLGHDPRLDRQVAVKVLPATLSADPVSLERFLREARAAARFAHRHVVTVHEIDEQDGVCFLAMELMAGSTLDLVRSQGRLGWANATRAIAAVCRALSAAHSAGLIHRDIKPSNILRTANGEVKLSDFGLAKVAGLEASLTTTNAVLGTPTYMSPEQCRGEPLDGRSDLYSLGVTYFELLTGRPPYVADQPLQVCFAHCASPVPDPSTVIDGLPPACAAIVTRAMAKEPQDRYATADEMLADLRRALAEASAVAGERLADATQGASPATPVPTLKQTYSPPARVPSATPETAGGDGTATVPPPTPDAPVVSPPPVAPVLVIAGGGSPASRRTRRDWLKVATVVGAGVVAAGGLGWGVWQLSQNPSVAPSAADWRPLFNGRDLTGWTIRPGAGQWTVENKTLVGRGLAGDSYCFHERSDWTDFRLRVECRINDRGNSGLFFRCTLNDSLPTGYEAHIDSWNCGRLHRNGLSGNTGIDPEPHMTVAPNEWFEYEVLAHGSHIQLKVKGQVTVDYHETQGGPRNGLLALQCFDRHTVVEFRRIEWQPVEP
ncbi:MAG: protein kinase [Pirellulales bacterium]